MFWFSSFFCDGKLGIFIFWIVGQARQVDFNVLEAYLEMQGCFRSHFSELVLDPQTLLPFLTVNYDVTSARDMLLLDLTQDEQKKWIGHLGKKIPKTPPSTFSRASPRSMSTRSGPNQSFRKNPKSNTGKLR